MRPRLPAIATLALTLLLGACQSAKVLVPPNLRPTEDPAKTLEQARQNLQQATPCCTSFADFSYANLLPWRPKAFTLGQGGPVVNLNGTHSYFLAFRLPTDVKLPYEIALKAELNGRWLHASYLFAPTVVVLDEAFQPLDHRDVTLCEYMGWSDKSSGAFGRYRIDNPKARYLVIYSSAAQQGGSTYWEQSPAVFSVDSPVVAPTQSSFRIPHGPDGTLWVGLMNHSFRKAVDNAICDKATQGDGILNTLRTALPLPWSGS